MNQKFCEGCRDDPYNHGLGGATKCWLLDDAYRIRRRRVGINERPPWLREPELLPNCYQEPGYVFVGPEVER